MHQGRRAGDDFADVLDAAQKGEEWGLSSLWRSHQPALLRYLRVAVGDASDDVAQETWIAAARNLSGFSGDEDNFRSWLFTITRRRLIDHGRSAARRPEHQDDSALARMAGSEYPEDTVIEQATTRAALDLIATLPPDQAEAITLRVVGGLSVAEVAEIMSRGSGAVRVLTHRGLRRLASQLGTE